MPTESVKKKDASSSIVNRKVMLIKRRNVRKMFFNVVIGFF